MPFRTLNKIIFTDKEHTFYVHFPLCSLELQHVDLFPWNQRLNKYLCCFMLWGCLEGKLYLGDHLIIEGR